MHRYPDRVLFLVTDRCAAYCRYCTRSRLVSNASGYDFHPEFDRQIEYIREHPEIRDVLLSGGDPLLFSDEKLEYLLSQLRAIPHVEFLRIGTRIPIFLPQRITPALCAMLKKYHPLFISIHSNHPRELTTEVRDALGRLADAGIPLGNQSVLLRNVNDDAEIMKAHVQKLLMCRVKPYYLYQCDLIAGSAHLRASVRKGLEIMEALRGHTTRLRRAAICHRCSRRRRQSAGQSRIRPQPQRRPRGDPQLRRQNFRISRSRRRHAARRSAQRNRRAGIGLTAAVERETIHASKRPGLSKINGGLRAGLSGRALRIKIIHNPLQLLIATILSAQCSDKQVNIVTRELFKKYRTAADFASPTPQLLQKISASGFTAPRPKISGSAAETGCESCRQGSPIPRGTG